MSTFTKRFSAIFWPKYSHLADLVNNNAKVYSWIKTCGAVKKVGNRPELYKYLSDGLIKNAPIDYLEFGVHRGASIREWLALNTNQDSRFIGFDSFEGLPEKWNEKMDKGRFDVGGAIPQVDDDRVRFVKGWFQHTLPDFLREFSPRSRLVINNDSDLYSSTIYTLTQLNDILSPGTIIIFDEFSSPLHEFRAFNDYLSAFMRTAKPLVMTDDGTFAATQVAFEFE
jgi:O-methyltransferase